MHQQQTEPQGPGADGGQDEGHGAVRLQEEVAGVELPQEQQQHERVQPQSPAAARDQEVRTEGVTAATVVEAPAQVTGERHVEEEQLGERGKLEHRFYIIFHYLRSVSLTCTTPTT